MLLWLAVLVLQLYVVALDGGYPAHACAGEAASPSLYPVCHELEERVFLAMFGLFLRGSSF